MTIPDIVGASGLSAGVLSLLLHWRQRVARCRDVMELRMEMENNRRESLEQMSRVAADLQEAESNTQASLELLRDGQLGMPVRSRALRMLRSGAGTESVAGEPGLTKAEVRLLEHVGALLSPGK